MNWLELTAPGGRVHVAVHDPDLHVLGAQLALLLDVD